MKDSNINIELWDPLISEKDHATLNNLGIKTFKTEPTNIDIAFLCVNHDVFKSFLQNFEGIICDYKYIFGSK